MFSDFWPEPDEVRWANQPTVDIKETEKEIMFFVDLPGVDEKDVDVEFMGDCLTISAKREFNEEEKRDDYVRLERSFGSFQRSFTLNFPVKPGDVKAEYEKGVLRVVVPKAEVPKTHHVPVKAIGK
jgi:HSP20 family protein